ncbi:uncharacterized protein BCR38DRAFT_525708 [Pseudomassariella vexata]|uniref:Uncharacterized protein n=1 Tax=Pseudomassariella vexata TaxID=1141098 RepID=A0A1Y2DPR7_9PEZI|nr:uncharacterized protein BCR38DRAFT_525708 [Pseudomassariella vexata]ORY61283.1 hypothetical protein BCR38DRAFT_525708 [Pseudomassariella vexata]
MAAIEYDEIAVMDDLKDGEGLAGGTRGCGTNNRFERSPLSKTRSLSDGGGTQLSPSPQIVEASRRASKDDSSLRDSMTTTATTTTATPTPVTPRRPDFPIRGLSLQMPRRDATLSSAIKPTPLSPKLDHSQIYASPTNILPRRSRGLDFSRAATSLHHSTLAEQSSPDSSPTAGGRAMNIPGRKIADYGIEQSTNSLWSMMGNQERMHISSSLGSTNMLGSDSSSSSDNEDLMDEDMEDAIMCTPQAAKSSAMHPGLGVHAGTPWMPGNSPAVNSLSSFRTRPRKQPSKKLRSMLGLPAGLSKSPPNNMAKEMKDASNSHSRRESISWAANQLHISGSEAEERTTDSPEATTPSRDGQRGVIRRVVTRRGNLLPKTKGFARIRAALAEENTPIDSEVRREAEVVRQVYESDVDLEPRAPPPWHPPPLDIATAQSPNLNTESLDEIAEDEMMGEVVLSSSFKQQALKNSKGKVFWDTFSESSSVTGGRTTPPPPVFLPRGSSSGISEDVNMDSPSLTAASGNAMFGISSNFTLLGSGSDGQRSDTPQPGAPAPPSQGGRIPPTAEEITRRINNKRRRDDDFDPGSFKRRAVSPGMSVHNSPIMQSPLQRDLAPWGSRPGSNHGGDKASGTPSENGSSGGNNSGGANGGRPINGAKGRVGFQGMVDTNDGLMRMSIE